MFLYGLWEGLPDRGLAPRKGFMPFGKPTIALTWTSG